MVCLGAWRFSRHLELRVNGGRFDGVVACCVHKPYRDEGIAAAGRGVTAIAAQVEQTRDHG